MSESGWRCWQSEDGTIHVEIVLTAKDQAALGPYFMDALADIGVQIEAAFAEPD